MLTVHSCRVALLQLLSQDVVHGVVWQRRVPTVAFRNYLDLTEKGRGASAAKAAEAVLRPVHAKYVQLARQVSVAALLAVSAVSLESSVSDRSTAAMVHPVGRLISPRWGSIRFRLALRTYALWGVRVVSLTKSRKIPTEKYYRAFS